MESARQPAIETRLIHAGEPLPRVDGAVTLPIFQTSTYLYTAGDEHDVRYIRYNNTPNHQALHTKLASLEGAEGALVTASGMAAISATLLNLLSAGDHMIAMNCLYGATHSFVTRDLPRFGITCTLVDDQAPETWARAVTPNTRVIYAESITNPQLNVPDHATLVAVAREHGLVSVIDNTFASPINFRPIEAGYDVVLHSCSKYLNGHTDIVAGAMMSTAERIEGFRRTLNHLGGTLDPHACFLLHRGLKTLAVRVRQQNANALEVARGLAANPGVTRVCYPGLSGAPGHARAAEWFDGFGGMVAFEPAGGGAAAKRLLDRLRLVTVAPSLGGPETLISSPATTSHVALTVEERRASGISDGLLRLSVGLEAPADILADLIHALGTEQT